MRAGVVGVPHVIFIAALVEKARFVAEPIERFVAVKLLHDLDAAVAEILAVDDLMSLGLQLGDLFCGQLFAAALFLVTAVGAKKRSVGAVEVDLEIVINARFQSVCLDRHAAVRALFRREGAGGRLVALDGFGEVLLCVMRCKDVENFRGQHRDLALKVRKAQRNGVARNGKIRQLSIVKHGVCLPLISKGYATIFCL